MRSYAILLFQYGDANIRMGQRDFIGGRQTYNATANHGDVKIEACVHSPKSLTVRIRPLAPTITNAPASVN